MKWAGSDTGSRSGADAGGMASPQRKPSEGQERPTGYELHMRLENCHGIGRLDYAFRFPDSRPHMAIYASNGTMKSSLAKTLKAIAKDDPANPPRDDIYPERKSVYDILDKDGQKVDPGSILVIESYENAPATKDRSTGILVNARLRDQHRNAVADITNAEKKLLARLSDRSGVKVDEVENRLLADFGAADKRREAFYSILADGLAIGQSQGDLAGIKYQMLFNAGTDKIWDDPDFVKSLDTYIEKYDMLVEKSPYLDKKFNHTGVNSVKKTLDDTGFFLAEHVVGMRPDGGEPVLMGSGDLQGAIDDDMKLIEEGLRDEWTGMDKILKGNKDKRGLRDYLTDNKKLIPRLGNIGELRRDLWKCYIAQEGDAARRVVDTRRAKEEEVDEIVTAAESEHGTWEDIIKQFHDRFDVPFRMHVDNKAHAVVGLEAPRLMFTHHEKQSGPGKAMERDQLDKALSTGEKKAFFTLNTLFMIQAKIDEGRQTLVVLDDIVDSFDYKNKYAVVEYLKELSDSGKLHLLILTHNFDFLRTMQSRGVVSYGGCRFVERDEDGTITLKHAEHLKNPLTGIIADLGDRTKIAAAIPFTRNMVEYMRDKGDPAYATLSDMLHWREGKTNKITIAELDCILRGVFNKGIEKDRCQHDRMVWEVVDCEANRIASSASDPDLYDKVALSVAIRIRAERFISSELAKRGREPPGERPKTHRLIADYKKYCSPDADGGGEAELFAAASGTLDRVALMTPEVIHLNSFMYEPILDMSGRHLAELYKAVRELDWEAGGA